MSRKASLAKISRPRLFGVVPRERLFALLDDNCGRPLIWISGPPARARRRWSRVISKTGDCQPSGIRSNRETPIRHDLLFSDAVDNAGSHSFGGIRRSDLIHSSSSSSDYVWPMDTTETVLHDECIAYCIEWLALTTTRIGIRLLPRRI